jgi:membrane fusion protein, adhesin transport system
MSRPDAEQFRELLAAARRRPHLALSLLMPVGAAAVVSGVLWAHFAAHEVVASAEGKIVPSPQVENVQAREGGILRDVLVAEGDRVVAGQVVARLEDASVKAELDGQKARRLVLAAATARLAAEADGSALNMPAEISAEAPHAAAREKAYYKLRQAQLETNVQILGQQLTQRKSDMAVLQSRERTLNRSMAFLSQELSMGRDLASRGLKSKLELLKLERQVSEMQGEVETVDDRMNAAQAAVGEAQRRVDESQQSFELQALQDLGKAHAEIAALDASLGSLSERLARQELRAPRDGVVKKLMVADAGTMVTAGTTIFEESSTSDDLLIEGKVRPSDIALLRPGQTASVRIGNSGSRTFGMLPATLEQVSQVARGEPSDAPSFLVRVHTERALFSRAQLGIQPGMTATVNINVGRESVLDFLLEPVRKVRQQVALADG